MTVLMCLVDLPCFCCLCVRPLCLHCCTARGWKTSAQHTFQAKSHASHSIEHIFWIYIGIIQEVNHAGIVQIRSRTLLLMLLVHLYSILPTCVLHTEALQSVVSERTLDVRMDACWCKHSSSQQSLRSDCSGVPERGQFARTILWTKAVVTKTSHCTPVY